MTSILKPIFNPTETAVLHELLDIINFKLEKPVNILVVVDSSYWWQHPGEDNIKLKNAIDSVVNYPFGFSKFNIHIASREGNPGVKSNAGPYEPRFFGFRFNMKINGQDLIDDYQQIWLLSSKVAGNTDEDPDPSNPMALVPDDAELAKLTTWMNEKQGGIFAGGADEATGAATSYRIPRIRTMRRWTMAAGADCLNTLRPASPDEMPGYPGQKVIWPYTHNYDTTMQPLQWVVMKQKRGPLTISKAPHPILCHPYLGPIDVMPDDRGEGLCYDDNEVTTNLTYDFDGTGQRPEYPPATNGNITPLPSVIAYGSTLGDPPYKLDSPQIARPKFPLLNVYDGHQAGVGRCVTQSSYMHWNDTHTDAIRQENGESWKKISRFYLNVAAWLCPPGYVVTDVLSTAVFLPMNGGNYPTRLSDQELGSITKAELNNIYGPCWVTESLLAYYSENFREAHPFDPPLGDCLSCPPFELIEHAILAGAVRKGIQLENHIRRVAFAQRGLESLEIRSMESFILNGVKEAVHQLAEKVLRESRGQRAMWKRLADTAGRG